MCLYCILHILIVTYLWTLILGLESNRAMALLISLRPCTVRITIFHILLHAEFLPVVYKGEEVTGMLRIKLDLHEGKRIFVLVHTILVKIFVHSHNLVPESHFLLLKKKPCNFLCFFLWKSYDLAFPLPCVTFKHAQCSLLKYQWIG